MVICGTTQQRHAIAILPSRAQTMLATSDLDDFILITMWWGGVCVRTFADRYIKTGQYRNEQWRARSATATPGWLQVAH